MMQRIVVFGLSGVGKTSACRDYIARHPDFAYINAGQLLADLTAVPRDLLRKSSAATIVSNQQLLAKEFEKRLSALESDVLIDAHIVIDNDDDLVAVPVEVFNSMRPSGFILLEASAEEIARRRSSRNDAPGVRSVQELGDQSVAIRALVWDYARRLGVPLEVVTSKNGFSLDGPISALRHQQR